MSSRTPRIQSAAESMSHTLSMIKFSHTIFAMPFAILSALFAVQFTGQPLSLRLFALIIVAMITARNTAMAFNRWIDRKIDAENPRTRDRHLPSGLLSARYVLMFTLINACLFIGTTFLINTLCAILSPLALIIICGYSLSKRITAYTHFILGLSLAIAPIGAWIAVANALHPLPLLLGAGVFFWVAGFDCLYALQDENFDRSSGLRSLPARFGAHKTLMISRLSHGIAVSLWLLPSIFYDLGIYYTGSVIAMGLFLAWEQSLVRATDLSKLNQAFFTLNGVASVVFLIGGILEIWFG